MVYTFVAIRAVTNVLAGKIRSDVEFLDFEQSLKGHVSDGPLRPNPNFFNACHGHHRDQYKIRFILVYLTQNYFFGALQVTFPSLETMSLK